MTETLRLHAPQPRVGMRLFSDRRLTKLAAAGDERAFAAIYERYHPQLYRYCQALLGNPQDAQDSLQNAMVSVLRALPGEQRQIELKPWLYRIVHNAAMDTVRRRRPTEELDAERAPAVEDAQSSVEMRARLRELIVDLGVLPERQRGALVMRELGGMSFEEIASAFGTSQGVARQTVYEARLGLEQMAEGREMGCESVKQALSDGDGRVLRRRAIRSHLRSCAACRDFRAAIASRRDDLAAISPLSAVAAAGLLESILGGGKGGSGGGAALGLLGGGAGNTAFVSSAALKLGVTVVAAGAIAVPVGQAVGAIDLPLPGRGGSDQASQTSPGNASEPRASGLPKVAPAGASRAAEGRRGGQPAQLPQAGPPAQLPAQAAPGQQAAADHGASRVPAAGKDRGRTPSSSGRRPSRPSKPAPAPTKPPPPPAPPAPPSPPGGPGGYSP